MVCIARLEQTCKHLQTVIKQARLWRKILLNILENEPGLDDFLPEISDTSKQDDDKSDEYFKTMLRLLKNKLDKAWFSSEISPLTSRFVVFILTHICILILRLSVSGSIASRPCAERHY